MGIDLMVQCICSWMYCRCNRIKRRIDETVDSDMGQTLIESKCNSGQMYVLLLAWLVVVVVCVARILNFVWGEKGGMDPMEEKNGHVQCT